MKGNTSHNFIKSCRSQDEFGTSVYSCDIEWTVMEHTNTPTKEYHAWFQASALQVGENYTLPCYYAASSSNILPVFILDTWRRDWYVSKYKITTTCCILTQTSAVHNYQGMQKHRNQPS